MNMAENAFVGYAIPPKGESRACIIGCPECSDYKNLLADCRKANVRVIDRICRIHFQIRIAKQIAA